MGTPQRVLENQRNEKTSLLFNIKLIITVFAAGYLLGMMDLHHRPSDYEIRRSYII